VKQDANKKLGRGLSALLGESKGQNQLPAVNKNDELVAQIELTKIIAGIYQPRQHFNNTEIEELADSIKEKGVLQPIILRKTDDENYEIIAGERRYRACQIVGLRTIPAIIKKLNNHEALEFALIENIQRENLSPIEEALGYKKLINEFSYTQEEVAKKLGKSRSHIANLLRLLNLPQIVQNMLSMNQISMGHARAIINSQNPEELAQRIISESLNVRDVEELIRDEKFEESQKLIPTVKRENKVKLVNSDYVIDLERKISDLMEMEVKISFNAMKGAGKMTVKFDGIEALHDLIKKLK
jgi:ParB family chromosome partitioning protein